MCRLMPFLISGLMLLGIAGHPSPASEIDAITDITPPSLNFSPIDIAVEGDYACIAAGWNGLHIFDISDPANPVWVSRVDGVKQSSEIIVRNSMAYVRMSSEQFGVVNVADPNAPVLAGSITLSETITAFTVKGNYAYILSYKGPIYVVDIASPEGIRIVGSVPVTKDSYRESLIYISGYLFFVDSDGLFHAVDVTDPENPEIIHNESYAGIKWAKCISGGYAYTVDKDLHIESFYLGIPELEDSSEVINFSSNSHLDLIEGKYYFIEDMRYLRIVDTAAELDKEYAVKLELPISTSDMKIHDGLAVCWTRTGMAIVQIDPLSDARLLSFTATPHSAAGWGSPSGDNAAPSGDYIFLTAGREMLQIVDIHNPEAPSVSGMFQYSSIINDITVQDDYAYICGFNGLGVVDVSDISESVLVARLKTEFSATNLTVSGNRAYVVYAMESYSPATLLIVDINEPTAPVTINSISLEYCPSDIIFDGGYIYAACYDGVQIFDVDPPEAAHLFTKITFQDTKKEKIGRKELISQVYEEGDYLYALGHSLHIVDVSSLDSPEEISNLFISEDWLRGLAISNGIACVIESTLPLPGGGLLHVIDVNIPGSPRSVATLDIPPGVVDVLIRGQYAYVTYFGLRVIKLR